ncbi:hypothetical protein GII30_06395 [Gordonia amarae]|uniref:Bleomycin resistance protein n=2 Tax=Gordonia amarae TaxID=36821 RepID=G7GP90_9ACTN|nr:glyoxalase superfamily protein [Gordonia amarae]MCS3877999.1 catechol 2,3-dioxygenase-like lactoylglutathione lyase family enzyme [Gordonia amarae]QHN16700.1 hypothetical protein GII35_06620 [Gordonia amarae]QHN21225.1 hypothetical protein GII34_06400 [Gordonia amarae]QHN30079.1 hypothetical protein GII32_06410 [Gordonia amarae]QHN38852.1 hypothetical protein GII30_06395 [Gordonia amarae]
MPITDAKTMARRLRADLSAAGVEVTHSQALELVAHQHGYKDWNSMAAAPIVAEQPPAAHSAIPIFRFFDLTRTLEFYVDFLGFTVNSRHRFDNHSPEYLEVEREGVRLHLSEHYGDATPGSATIIDVADAATLQRNLVAREYRFARPGLETQPWGLTITIQDPAGNRIIFLQSRTSKAERVEGHGAPIVSEITVPVDAATAYDAFIDIGRWWDRRLSPEPATFEGVHVGAVGEPVLLIHRDAQYPIGTVTHAERGVRYSQTFTLAVDSEYPTTLSAEFVKAGEATLVRLSHGGWTAGNAAERAKFTEWPELLRRYAATLRD